MPLYDLLISVTLVSIQGVVSIVFRSKLDDDGGFYSYSLKGSLALSDNVVFATVCFRSRYFYAFAFYLLYNAIAQLPGPIFSASSCNFTQ